LPAHAEITALLIAAVIAAQHRHGQPRQRQAGIIKRQREDADFLLFLDRRGTKLTYPTQISIASFSLAATR
jgi:putative heme iron utilization protein